MRLFLCLLALLLCLILPGFSQGGLSVDDARNGSDSQSQGSEGSESDRFTGDLETQAKRNDAINFKISEAKSAAAHLDPDCRVKVGEKDHLLFDFQVVYENGTILPMKSLGIYQTYYYPMFEHENKSPLYNQIMGMCEGSVKKITGTASSDLGPFVGYPNPIVPDLKDDDEPFTLELALRKITADVDFQVFSLIRKNKWEEVYDMLDRHEGINAVDEWGQSLLILAVAKQYEFIVPPLLNSRLPKVDVNFAKTNGITALYYAVEQPKMFSTFQALLKKGADPNIKATESGNTPLHIACLLEKPKYAEILLEYGASMFAMNEYGQTPGQLVPRDCTPSVRTQFSRIFKEARDRDSNRLSDRQQIFTSGQKPHHREL